MTLYSPDFQHSLRPGTLTVRGTGSSDYRSRSARLPRTSTGPVAPAWVRKGRWTAGCPASPEYPRRRSEEARSVQGNPLRALGGEPLPETVRRTPSMEHTACAAIGRRTDCWGPVGTGGSAIGTGDQPPAGRPSTSRCPGTEPSALLLALKRARYGRLESPWLSHTLSLSRCFTYAFFIFIFELRTSFLTSEWFSNFPVGKVSRNPFISSLDQVETRIGELHLHVLNCQIIAFGLF